MNNKIPGDVIRQRAQIIQKMAEEKQHEFYKKHINEIRPVLFEHYNKNGEMFGFTDNYIKVETRYNENLAETIKNAKLVQINNNGNVEIKF